MARKKAEAIEKALDKKKKGGMYNVGIGAAVILGAGTLTAQTAYADDLQVAKAPKYGTIDSTEAQIEREGWESFGFTINKTGKAHGRNVKIRKTTRGDGDTQTTVTSRYTDLDTKKYNNKQSTYIKAPTNMDYIGFYKPQPYTKKSGVRGPKKTHKTLNITQSFSLFK